MATIILENNYFEFDGEYTLAKAGDRTAIGTGLPRLIMLIIYVCFGDKNAKRVRI